jgi:hypothetical protein
MEKLKELLKLHFRKGRLFVNLTLSLFVILAINACQNDQNSAGKVVEEIKTDGKISSIIRNPVTANEPTDTVNVARIVFEEMAHDFGEIKEGAVVEHTFNFKNEGKVPLIISNVRSSCGCTAPSWPKDPIEPGKSGKIQVQFNSSGKYEQQVKPVIITANTFPPETKLSIKAFVEKKQ